MSVTAVDIAGGASINDVLADQAVVTMDTGRWVVVSHVLASSVCGHKLVSVVTNSEAPMEQWKKKRGYPPSAALRRVRTSTNLRTLAGK